MELFRVQSKIDFMGRRKLASVLSAVLLIAALSGLVIRGLNFGIDFTGGVLVEVSYPEAVELNVVRPQLASAGFADAIVQHFGTSRDVLIRIPPRDDIENERISDAAFAVLQGQEPQLSLRRVEFVGPQVGEELANDGGLALLVALLGILIYVALRFEYRFALGAVAALVHDVLITLGMFAWTQITFDLSVLAALLAVIGYSLNDTIVVFDRIRENFIDLRKVTPTQVINASINQTLSRTLMTSFTTLLVLLALLFIGGAAIQAFAIALTAGIVVGTYSSIYVASNLALMLGVNRANLLPVNKDDQPKEQL
ncbi:MAG: protein translocase subunit SecF [Pseudomonadota bacterium]|nr:protein translocase subunit SecF [Pseudomonadota bacterium]